MGRETTDVSTLSGRGTPARRLAAAGMTVVLLASTALLVYAVSLLLVAAVFDPASVTRGRRPPLVASIVATTVLAVALRPLHGVVRGIARRAAGYEPAPPDAVLLRFAEEMAVGVPLDEALPRLAAIAATATTAGEAAVWVVADGRLVRAASWPADANAPEPSVALDEHGVAGLPNSDTTVELRHRGELLGALTIKLSPGAALRPVESELLAGLASDGALVVHNAALTAQLQARITLAAQLAEELRSSRRRILAASQATRRRLERDIHDSTQQQVLALTLRLHELRSLVGDPVTAVQHVTRLRVEAVGVAEHLRSLARDVYPPLLRDAGLAGALAAHATSFPVRVRIEAGTLRRHDAATEIAVYFACLEALQNAAKHSGAEEVVLRLEETAGELRFEVRDRGTGFDSGASGAAGSGLAGIADRIHAVGGRMSVASARGEGTTVVGVVPLAVRT
jgi:signal transduction histidine kinase